jgi:hypothetical protein
MNAKTKMIGLGVLLLVIFALVVMSYVHSPVAQASSGSGLLSPSVLSNLPTRETFLSSQPQELSPKTTEASSSTFSGIQSSLSGAFSSFVAPPPLAEGFDNILTPAIVGTDPVISTLSSFSGNVSCFGKSFGLSNSTGSLCVDQNTYNLLTTRGGNSTGN